MVVVLVFSVDGGRWLFGGCGSPTSFRARPRVIPSAARNLPSPLMGEGQGEGDRGGHGGRRGECVLVVWLAGPRPLAPFPLTLALSHEGRGDFYSLPATRASVLFPLPRGERGFLLPARHARISVVPSPTRGEGISAHVGERGLLQQQKRTASALLRTPFLCSCLGGFALLPRRLASSGDH